jgi:hypothetical protein
VRVRSPRAAEWASHVDPAVAAVARGIIQHHADDRWFHETRAFVELNLTFAVRIRDRLPPDEGFRPSFLGHILIEILLDDVLAEQQPGLLDTYYQAFEHIDPGLVEQAVTMVAAKPVANLSVFIRRFCAERFLYDYADDGKLLTRLNAVMRRVGLAPLPDEFCELLPEARRDVHRRRSELLAGEQPSTAVSSPVGPTVQGDAS